MMDKSYKLNINGLDDKMDGGIPDKHIVLLAGTPGTMKSTLAYRTLMANAQDGETKALYLTLEQDRDNFMYHLTKLGMDDNAEGRLNLYDLTTTREQWMKMNKDAGAYVEDTLGKLDLETFKRQLETLKNAMGFDLLVIDSLPVVEMMFKMDNPRDDLFYFFKWLKRLGVTTFLITEMTQGSPKFSKHDIDFLADGIIKLSMEQVGPTKNQRQIQIIKMRGVNHTTDIFELRYTPSGFEALKVIN